MEKKVLAFLEKHKMIKQGDRVVAALSGGADSVALVHILKNLEGALGISVSAAHFNHGLRGDEANADQSFAANFCAQHSIILQIGQGTMLQSPRPKSLSEEAWARELRYKFFETIASESSATVATGHTLSDNAETVIFNAARGAGTRGLAGIPPVREVYIRPLLSVSRDEVENYCKVNNLSFVTDKTNYSTKYSRNRIRHNVLPELEKAHPGAQIALNRLAEDMRVMDDWLAKEAEKLLQNSLARENEYNAQTLLAAPQPVLLKALYMFAGTKPDRKTLANIEKVLIGEISALQLSVSQIIKNQSGRLVLVKAAPTSTDFTYKKKMQAGSFALPGGYNILVEIIEDMDYNLFSKEMGLNAQGTKTRSYLADYDKIPKDCFFRNRQEQDSFTFAKRNLSKTVKKWMNEKKFSLAKRHSMPLLASGSTVVWLWGEGFCAGAEADEKTTRYLRINAEASFEL